jgi:hypothetical protein
MKLPWRRIGFGVLVFLVFAGGCFAGLMVSSYLYYRFVFSVMLDRDADELLRVIPLLCRLRLGETEEAIQNLESTVDGFVIMVGATPHVPVSNLGQRALESVKTYRQLVPSTSERKAMVDDVLRGIPPIDFSKVTCDSPLCRFVIQATPGKAP